MRWFVLVVVALLVAACEDGTRRIYPNPDNGTGTVDTDDLFDGDALLPDDLIETDTEPLVNDDGQLINDDGQLINDDGELINDDGELINDDGELVNDDGTVITPDDTATDDTVTDDTVTDDTMTPDTVTAETVTHTPIPDDATVVNDDGVVVADDNTVITDDGPVITPDDGDIVQPDLDVDTCECSTGVCCDGCHFRSPSYVCRPAVDACDVAEYCTGNSASCPANGFASPDTACDDGIFCNGEDACNGNGGCTTHPGNPCGNFVCSENQEKCCDPGWAGADCEICVRFVTPPGMLPVVGDGLSWATAFTDIQQAIDSANNASAATCEVWVANGTYYVYKTATSDAIQLRGKVPLYGGFAGTEWVREDRDWVTNVTVIDGRQSSSSGNRVSHIMFGENNALVDGFTIQEGRAVTGNASNYVEGGAMYIRNIANMTVRNCIFTMNTAIVQSDDTYARGGAISALNSTTTPNNLTIENCVFRYNAVTIGAGDVGFGGAIYANGPGSVVIRNTIFDANSIAQNANGSTEASGGAVNVYNGRALTVVNSLFHDNSLVSSGTANGGAIRANDDSGAADTSVTITNCTFSQNSAKNGGAIANLGTTNTTIVNSILYANNATNVWNNTRQLYDDTGSGTITATYSDIQMTNTSVFPGTGNINADPLFVDANNNDFHLTANPLSMQISPCIDAANDSVAPATDLDGHTRFDVPVYGSAVADMGCYEFVY